MGGRVGAYWEGGKGCRNKIKMSRYVCLSIGVTGERVYYNASLVNSVLIFSRLSFFILRNDIHKYANSADKTKCKKQERVGKHATTAGKH